MGQISCRRMACLTAARPVEVSLTRSCIACNYVFDLIELPVTNISIAGVQEGCDVRNLRRSQVELRHALPGTAIQDDRRNQVPMLVVVHQHGTNQVRASVAAVGIPAVTERAILAEYVLAAVDGSLIRSRRYPVALSLWRLRG